MPFDGVASPSLLVLGNLEIAREMLSDPRGWCKGSLINAAGQMCVLAVLRHVNAEKELKPLILTAAREVTGRPFRSIERFNDHHKTTHATVLQVLDRTREGLASGRYVLGRRSAYARLRGACSHFFAATLQRA